MKNSELRRKSVDESLANWRSLKPAEQLAELDKRLGKDQGAAKQRARLKLAIAENAKPKKNEKVEKTPATPAQPEVVETVEDVSLPESKPKKKGKRSKKQED